MLRVPSSPGFTKRDSVELQIDIPFEKNIVLLRQTGSLAVRSDPAGAEIIVDGESTGFADAVRHPEPRGESRAQVSLRLKGYADGDYPAVEIVEDSTMTLEYSFSQLTIAAHDFDHRRGARS